MEHLNMRKIITTFMLLAVTSVAHAEPSSLVAFDRETRALIRSGDYANGEKLAKEAKCKKCHDMNGISEDTDDPNIAGMSRTYIFKQLMDYQNQSRDEKTMYKAVRELSSQDLSDLSAYYSAQEMLPPANPDAVPPVLVHKGDPKRMIRACNSCHGQNGQGGMHDMPALVGQRKGYFVTAMEEFKEEDRENDIYARMRSVSKKLTDEEIEALAEYYSAVDPE
jgi:cytochrome c553